jgi:hypothetical protein
LMSIGVGGAGLMACAGEGVPNPMHNARLAIDHHVFRTAVPMFSLRQESILSRRRAKSQLQVLTTKDHARSDLIPPGSIFRPVRRWRDSGRAHRARPVISASIASNSRGLAGSRRRLSRGVWLLPSLCCGPSRFGRWFNDRG